jgi:membrane fusion protein, heavy metal efflux system
MLDPVSRTLKVRCVLENKDHALKPEMYATVAISVDARTGLAIPRASVLRLGEQTVVFVDKGVLPNGLRRFVRVPVTIDERAPEGMVPLKHGLAKGDAIAVTGAQILSSLM